MFHVFTKYHKLLITRPYALFKFLTDYKIISFSLGYIFFDILILKFLRNIKWIPNRWLLIGVFFFTLILFYVLSGVRNICDKKFKNKMAKRRCSKLLYFLIILDFLLFIGATVLARDSIVIERAENIKEKLVSFTDDMTAFEGVVSSEISDKHTYNTIEVSLTSPLKNRDNVLSNKNNKILIKIEKYQNINIGDICTFRGTFKMPSNFEDFNYQEYLENKNIYLIMEFPEIVCSGKRGGFFLQNILVDFKTKLNKVIAEYLKEPQSSLLMGIIFGQDRLFSDRFDTNIRIAGVSHVVAASGYNITILILLGNTLFKRFSLKSRNILFILIIWGFTILSGLSASIVRACIMTTITLIAMCLGRKNSIHISLPLAACVYAIINPYIVFDVGFQLSIIATMGLIYLQPSLSNLTEIIFKKKVTFLDNTLYPTLSCTLATLCITIPTFKTFSIWSIPANILILPVIETTMIFGVLGLIASKISYLLAIFFFQIVNIQLKYFELVVNLIGSINWGYWEFEKVITIIPIVIVCMLVIICLYFYPINNETYNYYLKIPN